MGRCVTAKGDLGSINPKYLWVSTRSAVGCNHCAARKKAQFHQPAGCSVGKVKPVEYASLANAKFTQSSSGFPVRRPFPISRSFENELQHPSSMMRTNGECQDWRAIV